MASKISGAFGEKRCAGGQHETREEAAVRVKQAVEERVASQTKIYAQYAPGEVAKLEAACIETREDGWVVLLCVSADSARAAELMAEL